MSNLLFDPIKTQASVTDSVIVGFSGGKDSIVTLDLCFRYFKTVKPYFMYLVPGLDFQEKMLKRYEERLNSIFIDLYGLNNELSAEISDKDISIHIADSQREVKSLISYAVGCMFGRYSLDVPGLAFAGGEWDEGKYRTY